MFSSHPLRLTYQDICVWALLKSGLSVSLSLQMGNFYCREMDPPPKPPLVIRDAGYNQYVPLEPTLQAMYPFFWKVAHRELFESIELEHGKEASAWKVRENNHSSYSYVMFGTIGDNALFGGYRFTEVDRWFLVSCLFYVESPDSMRKVFSMSAAEYCSLQNIPLQELMLVVLTPSEIFVKYL